MFGVRKIRARSYFTSDNMSAHKYMRRFMCQTHKLTPGSLKNRTGNWGLETNLNVRLPGQYKHARHEYVHK